MMGRERRSLLGSRVWRSIGRRVAAPLGPLLIFLCLTIGSVSAEPDRLFFGHWFYFFGDMAYGESLEPPTSRIDVESGSITWVDEFGELFFRAQFEVIKDFGDHLVIKIEMRLAGDPDNPVTEIQTLALLGRSKYPDCRVLLDYGLRLPSAVLIP